MQYNIYVNIWVFVSEPRGSSSTKHSCTSVISIILALPSMQKRAIVVGHDHQNPTLTLPNETVVVETEPQAGPAPFVDHRGEPLFIQPVHLTSRCARFGQCRECLVWFKLDVACEISATEGLVVKDFLCQICDKPLMLGREVLPIETLHAVILGRDHWTHMS